MLLILLSVVCNRNRIHWGLLWQLIIQGSSVCFFAVAVIGMIILLIMGMKLERTDAKGNWLEQSVNLLVQLMILLGIVVL